MSAKDTIAISSSKKKPQAVFGRIDNAFVIHDGAKTLCSKEDTEDDINRKKIIQKPIINGAIERQSESEQGDSDLTDEYSAQNHASHDFSHRRIQQKPQRIFGISESESGDCSQETNPLFSSLSFATLAEAKKTVVSILEEYSRKRKCYRIDDKGDEEDEEAGEEAEKRVATFDPTWRFCGAVLSDADNGGQDNDAGGESADSASSFRFSGAIQSDPDHVDENDDTNEESAASTSSFLFSGAIQSDPGDEDDKSEDEEMSSDAEKANLKKKLKFVTPPESRKKRKAKRWKKIRTSKIPLMIRNSPGMEKYWKSRFQLFSRYDEGIQLDHESWFSVTPEDIAIRIAKRCATDGIIIDAFCGCGGNTIQFAKRAGQVIAIDIDPIKVENARHNARIYGVEDKITFVVADFMKLAPGLKGDVVFLSPPWGGPEYSKAEVFDLKTMIPMDGMKLFNLAEKISPNIAYYVPRNVDRDQLALLSGPGGSVEIESNCVGGHIKALTAYYGNLKET